MFIYEWRSPGSKKYDANTCVDYSAVSVQVGTDLFTFLIDMHVPSVGRGNVFVGSLSQFTSRSLSFVVANVDWFINCAN